MARYRALMRGQVFADDVKPVRRGDVPDTRRVVRVVEPGEIFEWSGKPPRWAEPVSKNEVGESAKNPSGSPRGSQTTSPNSSNEPGAGGKP